MITVLDRKSSTGTSVSLTIQEFPNVVGSLTDSCVGVFISSEYKPKVSVRVINGDDDALDYMYCVV